MTDLEYYKLKSLLQTYYIIQLLDKYNMLARIINHPRMIYNPDKLSVEKLRDYFINKGDLNI